MRERGDAIVLVGFMGVGKSSVGVELCRRTGLRAFDTDAIVVAKMNSSIAEIFDRLGAETFREEETEALRGIPHGRHVIITGGGSVLRAENLELMRALGVIVWLQADAEAIFRRVAHRDHRPLLRGGDPRLKIRELLEARENFYRDAAEIVIDTSRRTPAEVAQAILEQVPTLLGESASHAG